MYWNTGSPLGKYTGKNVLATPEEQAVVLAKREDLRVLRETLQRATDAVQVAQQACDHKFFMDTRGDPYDIRCCSTCGKFLTMI